MQNSVLLAVVVVVVVVVVTASPTLAHSRNLYMNGPSARWPLGGPFHGPPLRGSYHPYSSYFPRSGHDFHRDQFDSSSPKDPADDLSQRIAEVRNRCQADFLLLRRLLQEQSYLLKGSPKHTPWKHPVFRFPFFPDQSTEVEQEEEEEEDHSISDGFPIQEIDHEHDFDTPDSDYDETNIFSDSPTLGPEWHVLPYLPEVPDLDDLPDNYDNETHSIISVNGSLVEVNTTTKKETTDTFTTFFHTEVFHILPEDEPGKETPKDTEDTSDRTLTADEDVAEQPVAITPEDEEEVEESPAEPEAEEETKNKVPFFPFPIPAAELVVHEVRPVRGVPSHAVPAQATAHRSSAYVKGTRGHKGKTIKPKDLSGDTLVNNIPRDSKTGNTKDPDAEIIL